MVKPELVDKVKQVIHLYAEHGSLRNVCEIIGVSMPTLAKVRAEYPLIEILYQGARQVRADVLADEIPDIADSELNPHRARVRIDARRWYAGVLNRQAYGDKIDMTIEGRIDLISALQQARARAMLPMSDPLTNENTEAIETTAVLSPESTDKESEDPTPTD